MDTAWDAGIRYFDTAPHYGLGLSERRLGAPPCGRRPRDSYLISTKVGRLIVPSQAAHRGPMEGFDVPATHRAVRPQPRRRPPLARRSLERLGLDRIDIAYLHDPDGHGPPARHRGHPALTELRDQGVIGAVGAGMNQSAMLTGFVEQTTSTW